MKDGQAAYIGLGSNLGDAAGHVRAALARLGELPQTTLAASSDLFRTAPVDAGGDDYINAVALVHTKLDAPALLAALQQIEQEFGRERPYRNAPRTLDLDLLLHDQQVLSLATLELPHPRMTERAFVLIPLLQIDPYIHIPGKGPAHSFVPAVANQIIQRL